MRFYGRTAVRTLAGAGLIGASALGLAAPAAAEEQPVDFTVGVVEAAGWAGDTAEVYVFVENTGIADLHGFSSDFTVPDGATITGIVGQEFVDGTDRPDEGCALVTEQRVECHTDTTLLYRATADLSFEIELADDATGVLGPATYTVTADEGGTKTAEADVTALAGGVALQVHLEPEFQVIAPPGAEFEQTVVIRHDGGPAMRGTSIDFHPAEGVTVTDVTGLELVDGAERPDEGCAVVEAHLECHTNATLLAATTEVTILQRMPETAAGQALGAASVRVAGDNGGEGTDAVPVYLDVDPRVLEVTATPSAAAPAGEVVDIVVDARNRGPIGVAVRLLRLTVPEGATVVGVEGYELGDESTWPDEGCALLSPQQVECLRTGPLLIAGGAEQWRFQVRLDDDAPVGELGVAALSYRGGDQFYEAETVLTVTDGAGGGASGGTDSGGTAAGGDDGEELPDTGAGATTALAVAAGLLLAGAALTLRTRKA